MDFVNQINFEPAGTGRVLHVIEQVSRIIDAGAGSGIDFDKIYKPAFINANARAALAARLGRDALLAIQAFGQNSGNRGLSNPASHGE